MKSATNPLKTKKPGYYFVLAISLLALAQLVIYLMAFPGTQWEPYYDQSVVLLSGAAALLGIVSLAADALFCWKAATHFGGGLCLLLSFLSFLMFNRYGYMYYSELFFGGIEVRLIFSMYYGYLYSLVSYILIFVLGICACFMKHDAAEEV